MSNFSIITNLRTNESGEDDLSFEWMKEESLPASAAGSPLTDISLDQLERFSFAKKIARAISKRKNEGSIVLGLYGAPGEGKTTVLNFLGYELAKSEQITYLRFNPSRAVNSTSLIRSFFEALSDTIETSDEISGSIRKKVARMLSIYSSFLAPGEEEQRKRGLFSKSPAEIKKSLDASFRKLDRKIVFLVDDLDKMELNEVRTFLRLIKLSVNFPNTVFVLSFDEQSFSMQIGGGRTKEGRYSAGRKILQKVVHLPLSIPPAGKSRLLEMCFGGISELLAGITGEDDTIIDATQMNEFKETFHRAFSPALKTPRQCSLYLNALTSSMPERARGLDSRYFMLIEALRVFYPAIYEVIRNNSDAFIGVEFNEAQRSEVEENISHFAVKKVLDGLSTNEKEAIKGLLSSLFPCLRSIPGFSAEARPVQNPWIEDKPVASKQYFSRYFLLNTSGTDDFQRDVDRLLLKSAAGSIGDLALSVRKLVRQAGADAFIAAVENRIGEISPVSSGNLIRAFAQTGGSFLNPDTLFSFATVYAHPGILVRKLLLNINDVHDRFSIASFLMKESEPVSFAFECFRWIRPDESQERIFPSEIEDELSRILTERIRSLAYRYPLYLARPEETPLILSVWSFLGSREETTRYLESTFRQDPSNVVEFLKCYMPDEWLEESEHEISGSFLLNLNSSVSGLIDSKVLYKQLEKADSAMKALSSDRNSVSHRMLTGLASIPGQSPAAGKLPAKELKVFHITDYEKQKQKNIPEGSTANEEAKKGSLAQVSKGLYRPLFDLFN
ncbi:MAG TPA: P-loop NTPase fold protein [Ignavibacteriales bacterium]|nr:P-loop NTPase fold protein [Ignavibacteriales bacterium]